MHTESAAARLRFFLATLRLWPDSCSVHHIHGSQRYLPIAAGIAIGPILFVVAILAVLVGALAAGNGFDGSGTKNQTDRINASVLIEQGANLKAAFEKLHGGAIDLNQIVLSPTYSTGNSALAIYSASGGGLSVQTPAANTVPTSGVTNWRFSANSSIPGMGLPGGELVTVIGVKTNAICKAINSIVFGKTAAAALTLPDASAATVVLNDTGSCNDVTIDTTTAGCNIAANQFDISATAAVTGYSQACVKFDAATFYYYQIMMVK